MNAVSPNWQRLAIFATLSQQPPAAHRLTAAVSGTRALTKS